MVHGSYLHRLLGSWVVVHDGVPTGTGKTGSRFGPPSVGVISYRPQIVRVVPAAFIILPWAALDFGFDGDVLVFGAQFGPRHDAVFVGVRVWVWRRGVDDCFDDWKIILVGADLFCGLNAACKPKGCDFLVLFVGKFCF